MHIERALKVAERSGLKRHKTGAVIVDAYGEEVSIGWSHYSNLNLKETLTVHAELHAVFRSYKPDLLGGSIYVATFSGKSGNPCCSRPCSICLPFLGDTGLSRIVYTVSANGEILTEEISL